MANSPSSRTLKYLRDTGWPLVQVVEQWIPQARRRRDLFKFADILAVHPVKGHLYIQSTSGSNMSARLTKMREFAAWEITDVLSSGASVQIWGWRKLKGRGRQQWFPKIQEITMNTIHNMEPSGWVVAKTWFELDVLPLVAQVEARDGVSISSVVVADYPPMILLSMKCEKFSVRQQRIAGELAAEACKEALASSDNLELVKRHGLDRLTVRYALRPHSYAAIPRYREWAKESEGG